MSTMTMNSLRIAVMTACVGGAAALSACGGGGGGDSGPVSLAEPNAVMEALQGKVTSGGGGVPLVSGAIPVAAGTDAPKVSTAVPQTKAAPGDVISLPVLVAGSEALSNLYAKIPGSNNYFNVAAPTPAGKSLVRKAGTTVPIPVDFAVILDFRVELPDNLDLSTGEQVCFDFSVRAQGSNVRSADARSCIDLEAETPAPQDNQPQNLNTALQGTWRSSCQAFDFEQEEVAEIQAGRFVLGFQGTSFSQSFEYYSTANCQPSSLLSEYSDFSIGGSYTGGAVAYSQQNRRFQRPLNFAPVSPPEFEETGISIEPCFNVVSFDGQNTLYLGLPLTFTVQIASNPTNPVPGDCRSENTRPPIVLQSFPFTRAQ